MDSFEQPMMLVAPLPQCPSLLNGGNSRPAAPGPRMPPPAPHDYTTRSHHTTNTAASLPPAPPPANSTTSTCTDMNTEPTPKQCPMVAAFLAATKVKSGHRTITPPSSSSSPSRNNNNKCHSSRGVSFPQQLRYEVMVPSLACLGEDHRRSLWYTPADIDSMRTEARDLCRWLRVDPQAATTAYRQHLKEQHAHHHGHDSDNDEEENVDEQWRGLELRISLERQCRKQLTVQGVVRAQQRSNDPSFIAFIAQRCSALPREVALAQAQRDFCSVYHPALTKLLPSGSELTATATQQTQTVVGSNNNNNNNMSEEDLQHQKRQMRQQQLQELQQQVQLGLQTFSSSAGDLATTTTTTACKAASCGVVGEEFSMIKPPPPPCSAAGDLACAKGQEYKTLVETLIPFSQQHKQQQQHQQQTSMMSHDETISSNRFPFMTSEASSGGTNNRRSSVPSTMKFGSTGCTQQHPQQQPYHQHAHGPAAAAASATYATSIEDGCDALLQWQEIHQSDFGEDGQNDTFDPFASSSTNNASGFGLNDDAIGEFGPPPPMPSPQQNYPRAVSLQSYLHDKNHLHGNSNSNNLCCSKRQYCDRMPPPAPVPSRFVRRRMSLESTPESMAMAASLQTWNTNNDNGGGNNGGGYDWKACMQDDSTEIQSINPQMFG